MIPDIPIRCGVLVSTIVLVRLYVSAGYEMVRMEHTKAVSNLRTVSARSKLHCAVSCRLADNCAMLSIEKTANFESPQDCVLSDYALVTATDTHWTSYKIPTTKAQCKVPDNSLQWTATIPNVQPISQQSTVQAECSISVYSFALTADHYYVACWNNQKIVVIDRSSLSIVNVFPIAGKAWDVLIPPGSDYAIVTDTYSNQLLKVTPSSMSLFRDMTSDGASWTRGLGYQNGQILVGSHYTNETFFVDPATQQVVGKMPTLEKPHYYCTCASGRFMITHQIGGKISKYGCDRTVLWTIPFVDARGCACDHKDNFLVVRQSPACIYLVTSDGSSVTLYHQLSDVTGYVWATHRNLQNLHVENNTLYYLTDTGYIFVHSLQ